MKNCKFIGNDKKKKTLEMKLGEIWDSGVVDCQQSVWGTMTLFMGIAEENIQEKFEMNQKRFEEGVAF